MELKARLRQGAFIHRHEQVYSGRCRWTHPHFRWLERLRFEVPVRQTQRLISFLGLVPSEHGSGPRRLQGAITKTGTSHVRRVLVESAWSYRFPAWKTAHLQRKATPAPPRVQALTWAAQIRLCTRSSSPRPQSSRLAGIVSRCLCHSEPASVCPDLSAS